MSWMEKLYQTYEAAMLLDLPEAMLPIPTSHTLQNAHINIVIDGDGNFKRASVLEKAPIILPATESSASRGSGEAPHSLADKLQYVAKDYESYGGKKKAYFEGYRKQLEAWCGSVHKHEKVVAVFRYIQKGEVIRDLVNSHIVFVDPEGVLLTKWSREDDLPPLFRVLPKEKGLLDQGSALVCWTVEIGLDPSADTWKDSSIQASWISFDGSNKSNSTGLCYVTGNDRTLATNHPAKLRHSGDKAKLVSSNDSGGYTYRGKFSDENQACGIGFDVSQKAHNALRWLISRQGFRSGDQAFVSWATSGQDIPTPWVDSWSFLNNDNFDVEEVEPKEERGVEALIDHARDLGESYSKRLRNYMAGYSAKIVPTEKIIIMGIDSATPGRMGIIYYREMSSIEFLNRLESWHEQLGWPQRHSEEIANVSGQRPKNRTIWPISSPVPRDIAIAAYGENAPDNLKKKVIERLIPCIVDGLSIPIDLVNSCVSKATNRSAFANDSQWQWEKTLCIACALYKGYYQRHPILSKRKEYSVALEENYSSRDYLYGRLLSIAERIEEVALNVSGENRSTTAARLMQRFADRPCETWKCIELALQPYMQRLKVSRAGFLSNQIKELDAVIALFEHDEFVRKGSLSGEFLLGYHCQRQKFRLKTEGTKELSTQGEVE